MKRNLSLKEELINKNIHHSYHSIQERSASSDVGKGDISTGGSNGAGTSVELIKGSNWGNREGTEEDKEMLSDLIRDELRDSGNQGKSLNAHL